MAKNTHYDTLIIGGSYAGLAAAMALGRSIRDVLIIDSGKPCNRQTPHSHNFIIHDGETPKAIAEKAKAQVLNYDTVTFYEGLATEGIRTENGFEITTQSGDTFSAEKLLFATGITDQMPDIEGFAECWGISVLHCPYCHGYEVRDQEIGLIGNGDLGFELARLIRNWSKKLTLFTNGESVLTPAQTEKIKSHNIEVVEGEIAALEHEAGMIRHIVLRDGSKKHVKAVFARPAFRQHSSIPEQLGCELTEHGFIKVDELQQTTVKGIYAAGDNSYMMRAVASAVAAGTKAGAAINRAIIEEEF